MISSAPRPVRGRDNGEWAEGAAACRDKPARWFTDPRTPEDTRQALATCTLCEVRATCLSVALSHPADADVGVWGGTTARTRRVIRSEKLETGEVLPRPPAHAPPHLEGAQSGTPTSTTGDGSDSAKKVEGGSPRLEVPEISVARDPHGDFVDATGRVIIFRIHGDPPWMLMIDRRCIARTRTMTEARQVAWSALHPPADSIASEALGRNPKPSPPMRR